MAKRGKSSTTKKTTAKNRAGATGATSGASASGGARRGAAATDAGPMSAAQRVTWACMHLLVFLVPVAMSNWTWLPGVNLPMTYDQFDIIKVFLQRAITLVGFGAWAWHILSKGGRIRRTKIDYLILVLLGWILLTTFTSIHPPTAFFGKYRRFEGLVSFVNYAAIFFLVTQMADRASRIRSLARSLFFGGFVVNLYGVAQYLGLDPIRWGNLPFEVNRAFSTYGNPNLLGGYILFPLAIGLALALSEEDRTWRIVYWSGFLVAATCWVVAFTRGAWIGGVVSLAIVAFVAVRHRVKFNPVDYGFAGVIAAVVAALVFVSRNATSSVMNVIARLVSIFHFESGSALSRFQIWQAAFDSIKDRPILGFGADTFRLVFPKYKTIEYVDTAGYLSVADNVHNYPLQITSALGIPGALLLYGTFGAAAWFSAPLVFRSHDKTDRLVLAGFWAAAAGYLVHLLFGISVTGSTFLLWVAMAVVLSPLDRSLQVKPLEWGSYAGSVVVLLVAALSVGNVVYLVADHHYLKARVQANGPARVEQVQRAIALNPYNDMYRAELGMAYVETFSSFIQQARSAPAEQSAQYLQSAQVEFLKAEEALLDVIEFVPWEYDNYVFLANLYNVHADFVDEASRRDAIEIARKGVEVEQYGPAIRFQLARALQRAGEYEEAEEQIAFAVEMDRRYMDGWLLLGEIRDETGDLEGALEAYQAASELKDAPAELVSVIQALEASLAAHGGQ